MKLTNKNSFATNVKTITNNKTVRDAVQNAVIQALDFYKDNGKGGSGDTGYLTQLMVAAKANRGIRTKCLLGFIKEHANVKYTKITNKNGDKLEVFKKATGKKGKVITKKVDSYWYEWTNSDEAQADTVDFVAQAKSLLKRMTSNEKKLKEGTESTTDKLQAQLEAVLTA